MHILSCRINPCFAILQDESDQALAAYRTAARLFPGLHTPVLGMAMEYSRMHNLHLAEGMAVQAQQLCPGDPLVWHELGVLAYRCGWVWATRPYGPFSTGILALCHWLYIFAHVVGLVNLKPLKAPSLRAACSKAGTTVTATAMNIKY